MTNTESIIQGLANCQRHGIQTMTFRVGRYTGNNPSVIPALRRRGYAVKRNADGTYSITTKEAA